VSPKLAQTIASETGAVPIALNPLEGLSGEEIASGKTYISVQRENLQALKIALGCT
jgi:zinc transport system substrate-binding protein